MESLAEGLVDDLIAFSPNYDVNKGTFIVSSSSSPKSTNTSSNCTNESTSVRYVNDKILPAAHPPDCLGGGTHEIEGKPLHDKFTGLIDAVTGELIHGTRTYILTGETYEGPFCNGVRHGSNAIVTNVYMTNYSSQDSSLPDISSADIRYYGSYLHDRPHVGTLVVSSQGLGFTYHGPFDRNFRPHGENGTLCKQCGYKYEGNFKHGLFHGYGFETEISIAGGIYEGDFVSGYRQGYGSYSIRKTKGKEFRDCNDANLADYIYKGRWNNNQKQGEGEEIIQGKELYKGQFHMNERHGYGSLTFLNSSSEKVSNTSTKESTNDSAICVESTINDLNTEIPHIIEATEVSNSIHSKEQSRSLVTIINGIESIEKSGTDILCSDTESIEKSYSEITTKSVDPGDIIIRAEGQWRAGKPLNGIHGWTIIYENGDIFSGSVTDYLPEGYGVKRYKNKDIYTGQWLRGKRNGEGLFISANGIEEYIGEWIDNKIVPLNGGKKEEKIGRLTELALALLKRDKNIDDDDKFFDWPKNNGNEEVNSYEQQRNFLEKVIHRSLSLSMLHLDEDECEDDTCNEERPEYPKSWSKRRQSKVKESDHIKSKEQPSVEIRSTVDQIEHAQNSTPETKLKTYPNGDTYLGSLCPIKNTREGYGVYLSVATGSTYSGNFESDLRQGYGILLHPLGKYCGDFDMDAKHGTGTLILNDASSYYGQFKENLFHGRGTLCKKDGTVFVGDWVSGLKHGDGYETLPDGRVYMGEFKDDKRHGTGSLLSHSGGEVLYNGSWIAGAYHGQGLLVRYLKCMSRSDTHNSDAYLSLSTSFRKKEAAMIQYEGSFYNGFRHGLGTLKNTFDNIEYKGQWYRDVPVSGKWRISMNNSLYSGEATVFDEDNDDVHSQNDDNQMTTQIPLPVISGDDLPPNYLKTGKLLPQPHGFGTMKYENGDVYVGNFVKGLRHGTGTCIFENGQDRWDGEWMNDKMNRKGQMVAISNFKENLSDDFEEITITD